MGRGGEYAFIKFVLEREVADLVSALFIFLTTESTHQFFV